MATNYGVGNVTIGPRLVGHVAVTDVVAVPALSPRIRFGLSWTLRHLRPSGDEYHLIDFGGELRVGEDDQFVGTLVQDGSRHPLRSLDYVQTQEGFVALDLGRHRLERLEEHRAGDVLAMKMQLWPRIEMEGTTTDARVDEIRFQVPRDDWLAAVGTFTGEQIDLLEIHYHLAYANRYQLSLAELHRARAAVDRGDFNGAVVQARKAGRARAPPAGRRLTKGTGALRPFGLISAGVDRGDWSKPSAARILSNSHPAKQCSRTLPSAPSLTLREGLESS